MLSILLLRFVEQCARADLLNPKTSLELCISQNIAASIVDQGGASGAAGFSRDEFVLPWSAFTISGGRNKIGIFADSQEG